MTTRKIMTVKAIEVAADVAVEDDAVGDDLQSALVMVTKILHPLHPLHPEDFEVVVVVIEEDEVKEEEDEVKEEEVSMIENVQRVEIQMVVEIDEGRAMTIVGIFKEMTEVVEVGVDVEVDVGVVMVVEEEGNLRQRKRKKMWM